jgi:ubiquinone/menaquinone biosynthesis C-methylase UbiE
MDRERVDHYGATYGEFADRLYTEIRAQAFGEDIGQTGWLTVDEHDLFLSWLGLARNHRLLDVACGSGGPTLRAARLTLCQVHGIDIHEDAVRTARGQAERAGLPSASFQQVDASQALPFDNAAFDGIICVDAINHLPDRTATLKEWARVLRPEGRIVFTDPIVVSGPLTSEEIAARSSIGFFLFVPLGFDESVLTEVGFELIEREDRTENMARMARKWCQARQAMEEDLRRIEGDETFEGQQRFLDVAARLAEERRLARFAFCARLAG